MKPVGILGGMGPEATVLLMQKAISAIPAQDDADHVPLIVHQNPAVPSRIKRLIEASGEDPGPVLAQMARDLQAAGAKALAMPCNTAHAYVPTITAATPLPFLDMRAATVKHLMRLCPGGRIGMLASPAVRLSGVFDRHLSTAGLTPVWPRDDAGVLALIRAVKAGHKGSAALNAMADLVRKVSAESDHLLVACTELSLLSAGLEGAGWTDSLDCLVAEIVAFAQGKTR